MSSAINQSRILSEIAWEESGKHISEDLSAWNTIKHVKNSKSIELRAYTLRPKLMLPRPLRVKHKYRHVSVSPSPEHKAEKDKVEGIIFKLIEKSKIAAQKLKKIGQKHSGQKIAPKIAFLHYRLNLPRSLNSLKTPSLNKKLRDRTVTKSQEGRFSYYLNGTEYTLKGPHLNYLK